MAVVRHWGCTVTGKTLTVSEDADMVTVSIDEDQFDVHGKTATFELPPDAFIAWAEAEILPRYRAMKRARSGVQ